ncbi:uncharacterized protein K452DRAFT_115740 [Aplosporella prunicola CBS 121167]|uniref:Uncharacterized protein n=1 Tax=Aplosporella prunicola CBS 121167 TaxID=1176127 RepID=A0A6A6B0H6_9PEZI|nr:uncharacterized protein K452DRAFT_115740 [Aplosporella prunicola CBS 121167]KAF2136943.1 hypothetical protein K452DRAFT_115740 [Aplosporella prunicola CBS 121167]
MPVWVRVSVSNKHVQARLKCVRSATPFPSDHLPLLLLPSNRITAAMERKKVDRYPERSVGLKSIATGYLEHYAASHTISELEAILKNVNAKLHGNRKAWRKACINLSHAEYSSRKRLEYVDRIFSMEVAAKKAKAKNKAVRKVTLSLPQTIVQLPSMTQTAVAAKAAVGARTSRSVRPRATEAAVTVLDLTGSDPASPSASFEQQRLPDPSSSDSSLSSVPSSPSSSEDESPSDPDTPPPPPPPPPPQPTVNVTVTVQPPTPPPQAPVIRFTAQAPALHPAQLQSPYVTFSVHAPTLPPAQLQPRPAAFPILASALHPAKSQPPTTTFPTQAPTFPPAQPHPQPSTTPSQKAANAYLAPERQWLVNYYTQRGGGPHVDMKQLAQQFNARFAGTTIVDGGKVFAARPTRTWVSLNAECANSRAIREARGLPPREHGGWGKEKSAADKAPAKRPREE